MREDEIGSDKRDRMEWIGVVDNEDGVVEGQSHLGLGPDGWDE